MSLNECLLGNEFFEQKGIMALSDTPSANGMTAAELKAAFDDLSKNYVGKNFNKLINMLTELGVRGNFSLVGFYAQRWPRERNSKTPLSLSCPAMPAMRRATTTWRVAVFMADIIPNALSEK